MDATDTAAEIRADIAALPRRDTPSVRALRKAWSARLKPVCCKAAYPNTT